jgi:hypothetical protein
VPRAKSGPLLNLAHEQGSRGGLAPWHAAAALAPFLRSAARGGGGAGRGGRTCLRDSILEVRVGRGSSEGVFNGSAVGQRGNDDNRPEDRWGRW